MSGFSSNSRRALVHPLISQSVLLGTLIVQLVLSPIAAQGQGRTGTPLDEPSSSPSEWTTLELSEEDTSLLEDKMDELLSSTLTTFVENNPGWEILGPNGEALRGKGMLSSLRTLRSIREAIESDESGESNEDDKTPILSFGTPNLEDEKGRYIIELNRPEIEKEKAKEVLERGEGTIQIEIDLSARFLSQNHPIVLTASRNVEVNIPLGKKEAEMEEVSQRNLKEIEDSLISMMGELDQRNRALFPEPEKETKETSSIVQQKVLNIAGKVLDLLIPSTYSDPLPRKSLTTYIGLLGAFLIVSVLFFGAFILCANSLSKNKLLRFLSISLFSSLLTYSPAAAHTGIHVDVWYQFLSNDSEKVAIEMIRRGALPLERVWFRRGLNSGYSIEQVQLITRVVTPVLEKFESHGISLDELYDERKSLELTPDYSRREILLNVNRIIKDFLRIQIEYREMISGDTADLSQPIQSLKNEFEALQLEWYPKIAEISEFSARSQEGARAKIDETDAILEELRRVNESISAEREKAVSTPVFRHSDWGKTLKTQGR